jgi:predicted acyl esterase
MGVTRSCAEEGRCLPVGPVLRRRARISVVALVVLACTMVVAASASAFSASGSAEQVYVTGLPANAGASLLGAHGETLATQNADSLGGLLFRKVTPKAGYRVRLNSNGELSEPVTAHTTAAAPWDPGVYNQSIPEEGYTYLTTRDGTQLAIDVHPPTHPAGESVPSFPGGFTFPEFPANASYVPPYPTLIEYSGYGYANPKGPENGIAVLANLMGFAVVDVNMRGTGCSGGAFDFFEPLQNLDGYDVIQTIAKQPWVLNHKVGMLGISYGGISQLFTAQLKPPSLAAIAPLSVIDATATTLYPGGVVNDGFAVAWAEQRQQNAEPATGPGHGQEWANTRIGEGDATCKANQVLHGQAANLLQKIKENSLYHPEVADPLDPVTFVHNIGVPTFMACQFEDEQTGGHCANLVKHFTGTSHKWFTFTNGAHIDSLDPYTYDRLYDFYELYVAHKAPIEQVAPVQAAAPVVYEKAMGLPPGDVVTLPPDPIQRQPTYPMALAEFEKIPHVRVLFDNGAGEAPPGGTTAAGNPYPGFEQTFSELPVPGTTARTWYLGPHGTLTEAPPTTTGVDSYTSDANATPRTDYSANTGTGGLWSNASKWEWNWVHSPAGSAASYVSAPLTANAVAVGAGAIHLWVKSSTPDVDLQATVSEVGPEGNETFVQDGWLRASERKLATTSENIFKQQPTLLEPIPTFTTMQSMPANDFVPIVIPLYFEGHVYRAGSRIRVTIAAPNGTQPIWSFNHTQPEGTTATASIMFSSAKPGSVILPIVPGVSVPTGQPACPSLRNEPCRSYVEYVNNGS